MSTAEPLDLLGTSEFRWARWLRRTKLAELDLDSLAGRRVVSLAAHPGDDVMGAGGFLRRMAAAGSPIVACCATDGESSHPGSTVVTPEELSVRRPREVEEARRRLGLAPAAVHRFGLGDGQLAFTMNRLVTRSLEVLEPGDVVVTPWRHDGHPDHMAVGAAAVSAGKRIGAGVTVLEYPIWAWHWSDPAAFRFQLSRLAAVPLSRQDRAAKRTAIAALETQLQPLGPEPADAAILPPAVLAHFDRTVEVLLRA